MARKRYTDEFREGAVGLAREVMQRTGKGVKTIARAGLGVHPNTLTEWVRHDDSTHAGSGKKILRDSRRQTRTEQLPRKEKSHPEDGARDLKKAATFFAKENS